ncbi:hypothetical protein DJ95_103 [Bacillus atrophaeus subsp. globigii]|uniref:Uncharacterized protein n=1 Tax=Bacillus atrophaeus (strain 1942) TaxID=720555 RepID=A0ABM5LTU2_BACA1|nr:hypothetical protein BATR1942_00850 [Bacillus atrophaeus 1942]AIK46805.1 hypothetical protein DJ95_103 [Bacillus atrophaeus subsp. globigii]AKL83386.1 hypothetical protein D068_cds06330 [Bacillus atrophaeus UCMB-5137]EIM09270.1 hypothetical protein UY9_17961 [Bacillus atrophaeus C89]KFK81168.1 hypothetical protein DK44_3530 [Bacillus atrophaeus]
MNPFIRYLYVHVENSFFLKWFKELKNKGGMLML